MSNSSINAAGAVPDSTYGAPSNAAQEGGVFAPASQPSLGPGQDAADLRLVIEDDKAAGSFVYKTIDRRTGKVVQQYPREEVLRLREASDYTAGAVIKAQA